MKNTTLAIATTLVCTINTAFAGHSFYQERMQEEAVQRTLAEKENYCRDNNNGEYAVTSCLSHEQALTPEYCSDKQRLRRGTKPYNHFEAEAYDINADRLLYHSCLARTITATPESVECEAEIMQALYDAGTQEGGLNRDFSFSYPGLASYHACMDRLGRTETDTPKSSIREYLESWGTYAQEKVTAVSNHFRKDVGVIIAPCCTEPVDSFTSSNSVNE